MQCENETEGFCSLLSAHFFWVDRTGLEPVAPTLSK